MSTAVLVAGAGPAGLTLAIDLLRRGVSVRVVSDSAGVFPGSRAKGVQPRTQEVLDDLGVLEDVAAHATPYPPAGWHGDDGVTARPMAAFHDPSDDVPYPNTLLVAQHDTDTALRRRVENLGGTVDTETRWTGFERTADSVVSTLDTPRGTLRAESSYLVGADGGASAVRSAAGIGFPGHTDDRDRVIVADIALAGLGRDLWHMWTGDNGHFMALCPLPGGRLFQLMLRIRPEEEARVDREALAGRIRSFSGAGDVRVESVTWSSVWRPNIRLADRFRDGRVLLVGDAAHTHPPAGAQGLNTGIQDSYNLGWKLGQVLAGADSALLDTYEAERRPVAARVLGLSTELFEKLKQDPEAGMVRGDEERQLTLNYRGGPLARHTITGSAGLRAGDRMPDVRWDADSPQPQRLFDHLRGPHLTSLVLDSPGQPAPDPIDQPVTGASVRTVHLHGRDAEHALRVLGLPAPARVLVRPDGYVGYVLDGSESGTSAAADFSRLALPAVGVS